MHRIVGVLRQTTAEEETRTAKAGVTVYSIPPILYPPGLNKLGYFIPQLRISEYFLTLFGVFHLEGLF